MSGRQHVALGEAAEAPKVRRGVEWSMVVMVVAVGLLIVAVVAVATIAIR